MHEIDITNIHCGKNGTLFSGSNYEIKYSHVNMTLLV